MTICPNCGVQVEARAPIGEGTRAAEQKKRLNLNELAVGQILCDSQQPLTVRQVQGVLYERGIKRQVRREKIPSGSWNYHTVQIVLSMLLGAKLISATRSKEFVDENQYRHARPIPRYFMTHKQKERFNEIRIRNGIIKFSLIQLCPKCGHPVK